MITRTRFQITVAIMVVLSALFVTMAVNNLWAKDASATLSSPTPPTSLSLSRHTSLDDALLVAYTRSQSPHYYEFQAYRSTSQNGTYVLNGSSVNDSISPAYFYGLFERYWYKVRGRNCSNSNRTGCGSWGSYSAPIYLGDTSTPTPTPTPTPTATPAPTLLDPPSALNITIETNDNDDLDVNYTRSGESTHYYEFELHRASSQYGTYSWVETENDSSSPANFDNQTKGYWYKARGRNCETSSRTGCDDWSDWSVSIILPESLDPPTALNITIETNDDDDLDVNYTRSGESTHYYEFELHRASSQYGTYSWVETENDSSSPANFNNQTKGYWYKARGRNCETSSRTGCDDWSNWSASIELPPEVSDSLDPPTGLNITIETNDDDDLDVNYTRSVESTHYYEFELHRASTETGTYTWVETDNDSSSPANFNNQTKGYWYKARGRNCETSSRTGCDDWSSWSASIELPPEVSDSLDPPTGLNITIETNDDDDLDVNYTRSVESTHYYEFELHRASTETGTYTWVETDNDSSSPANFDDQTKGYWYKAQGRNCETSTRTGCGDWSNWSASIELPDPLDPPTMLGISIEVNDDDDLDVSYVQSGESTHYYEFELHRASTEAETYTWVATEESTTSPADFDDQTKAYWYKARGRNCETLSRTGCGGWSDWSPSIELGLSPPTNLSVAINADYSGQLDVSFDLATSPHYYQIELHQSDTEDGVYSEARRVNAASSPVPFTGIPPGSWYKAQGRNCETSSRNNCGVWSDWSDPLSVNAPPMFSSQSFTFPISETASNGSAIGTVTASDTNSEDTVFYTLTDGNDAGRFTVDSQTGAITVAASLDYETTGTHRLTLEATDSRGGADTATVFVSVTNVNEVYITGPTSTATEGQSMSFTVALDQLITTPLTVNFRSNGSITGTASYPVDFTVDHPDDANPWTVTVPTTGSATITVDTLTDTVDEVYETIVLALDPVSGSTVVVDNGKRQRATGTIAQLLTINDKLDNDGSRQLDEITAPDEESSTIWLKVRTTNGISPCIINCQDYDRMAYVVSVEVREMPASTWRSATLDNIRHAMSGYVDSPPNYYNRGSKALWVDDGEAPDFHTVVLDVSRPAGINIDAYRVTISKPNFVFTSAVAYSETDGAIKVMARNNTDKTKTIRTDHWCEGFDDDDYVVREDPVLAPKTATTVILCEGYAFSHSSRVNIVARLYDKGTDPNDDADDRLYDNLWDFVSWPFSHNTMWDPQRNADNDPVTMGGLQIGARDMDTDPDEIETNLVIDRCTSSFALQLQQGGTVESVISTTAHCTENSFTSAFKWRQGSIPLETTHSKVDEIAYNTRLPVSGNCFLDGLTTPNCFRGQHAYATLLGATNSLDGYVFKPRTQNTQQNTRVRKRKYFEEADNSAKFAIVGARPPEPRDIVHKVGRSTGWTSGIVIEPMEEDDVDPNCPGGRAGRVDNELENNAGYVECFVRTTLRSAGRDSGSPVFVLDDDPGTLSTEVILVGVVWGKIRNTPVTETGIIPIDRIYAESVVAGYDWATDKVKPLPVLNEAAMTPIGLDGTGWFIEGRFKGEDMSQGEGLTYKAALHRLSSDGSASPVTNSLNLPMEQEITSSNALAKFDLSDISAHRRSGELTIMVKLCVERDVTDDVDSKACENYGSHGGLSIKLPPAPQNLVKTGAGRDYVDFSWDGVENTSSYKVAYKMHNEAQWILASGTLSTTAGRLSPLSCGTYDIIVRALGSTPVYDDTPGFWSQTLTAPTTGTCADEGGSGQSGARGTSGISATEIPQDTPPSPQGVMASLIDGAFPISWEEVGGAAKYESQYRTGGATGEWVSIEDTTALSTTYTPEGGPACGSSYDFRVVAFGDGIAYVADWGTPSDTVSLTTAGCNRNPVFEGDPYAFSVGEDASHGYVVGAASATDPDTGDTVSYTITLGNDDGKFSVGEETGVITVVATLDYESIVSYALTVQASDGNGGAAMTMLNIAVTDVLEDTPPP